MKVPRLSRRAMLMAGGAVVGVGAVGAGWFVSASPVDLVYALIQRALPEVRLDRVSVRGCAEEIFDAVQAPFQNSQSERLASSVKLKGVRMTSQVLGIDRVASMGAFEGRLEEITRMAITRLLINSNFFEVDDPRSELIVYRRPDPNAACVNPFADLTPP